MIFGHIHALRADGHRVFLILAMVTMAPAMAQETGYKGNPHILMPADKPHESVPFEQQHITLPFPDSEATNLFSRGYQTMGGEVAMIRLSHRKNPETIHFVKIGDFVGNYRIDRVADAGEPLAVYLVKSNEAVVIRARTAADTHQNRIETGVAGSAPSGGTTPPP